MNETMLEYTVSVMDKGVPVQLVVWRKVQLPGDIRLDRETRTGILGALTSELTVVTSGCVTFKSVSDSEPRGFQLLGSMRHCPADQDLAAFIRTMIDDYAKLHRCEGEGAFFELVKVAIEKDAWLYQPSHWVCRLAPGAMPTIYVGMPQVVLRAFLHQSHAGCAKITVQSKSTGALLADEVVRLGLHVDPRVLRCPHEAPAQLAKAIHHLVDVFGIT